MPSLSSNTVGSANVAGTRFENISNPYSSLPRQKTGWDKFLNWLGFRSGYDKAQEQYNLAGAEYNAQLEQLASEEAYNSPLQQAARMREAGLNPDLTGVSGEPASEFDNQQQSPDVSVGTDVNPLDVVKSIGSAFMSTMSGTIALLNDVNLLKQAKIATDEKDLDFGSKMIQFFKDTDSYFRDPDDVNDDGSLNPYLKVNNVGMTLFHSNRNRKRFIDFRDKVSGSLLDLTTGNKSYDDFAKSAESLGFSMSQPWFNGFGLTAKDVADFLRPLSRAQMDLMFAQAKAENSKAYKEYHENAYQGDAYAKLSNDPEAAASLAESIKSGNVADIAENQARQSIAPLTVTKNRIIGKMISSIDKIPNKNIGTTILKFFLINSLSGFNAGSGLSAVSNVAKVL